MENPAFDQAFFASGLGEHEYLLILWHRHEIATLAVGAATNASSSLSIANFVALKILLQNLR